MEGRRLVSTKRAFAARALKGVAGKHPICRAVGQNVDALGVDKDGRIESLSKECFIESRRAEVDESGETFGRVSSNVAFS